MPVEHEELREMRSDLLGYMKERFDGLDERMRGIGDIVHDHESRLSRVESRCEVTPCEPKSVLKSPRTYAVGGIGTALGGILVELMRYFGHAPK